MPVNLKEIGKKLVHGTFMIYGGSGSGKTFLASTWPRPLFLSDKTERGWITTAGMSPDLFYDSKVDPVVEPVGSAEDMIKQIKSYTPRIQKGEFETLVIDSLSFYAQAYLAHLSRKSEFKHGQQLYGAFFNHIRYLIIEVHKLPCHVVWLCLAKEPDKPGADGGILLAGQAAKMAPASCSYWLYQEMEQDHPDDEPVFKTHLRRCGWFPARVRGAPESMPSFIENCTFKKFVHAIGRE